MPGEGLGIVTDYGLGPGRLFDEYETLYCLHQKHLTFIKSLLNCLLAGIKGFSVFSCFIFQKGSSR